MTPMLKQYFEIKKKYSDCLLFFRLGDFYEMFFDDAVFASQELELTLTKRNGEDSPPMCGVPHHSVDSYILKLTNKGYKVAICEQIENSNESKGIVMRDVVRVITPGTSLESANDNYIACVVRLKNSYALSFCNVTACEWKAIQIEKNSKQVIDAISKHMPVECLINTEVMGSDIEKFLIQECNALVQSLPEITNLKEELNNHFENSVLQRINTDVLVLCVGSLLHYLTSVSKNSLIHLTDLQLYTIAENMYLGTEVIKNLELIETLHDKSKKGSLLSILDKAVTPMGKREIKNWILTPLLDKSQILLRQDAVAELVQNIFLASDLREYLKSIYDLEKIVAKIGYKTCNAKDLIVLKDSILYLAAIQDLIATTTSTELSTISRNLDILEDIYTLINSAINEDAPLSIKDGGIIKKTYSSEVFKLKDIKDKGASWLVEIEARERESTGIKNLKIKYNKVFGYFLEVTNSNKNLVPEHYTRKQTLVNCERYITEELKDIEEQILNADSLICQLEYDIFMEVVQKIETNIKRILETSKNIAKLDAYISFSAVAISNNYVRPTITTNGEINIAAGRHPVAETIIGTQSFISNDTGLGQEDTQIALITGPNMGGKSTYMKQVGLIVILAQIGSFVPATSAEISVVDKIFTRVGASDDLISGKSTFMVEMSEVSNILINATSNSLLILDEIGRGTSTLDGLSIAQAVIEYIAINKVGAKTLFSTHYHELPQLVNQYANIKNYCVTVQQNKNSLIFLHKIAEGVAGKSFGLEVAKLAGLPVDVLHRAGQILSKLDAEKLNTTNSEVLPAFSQSYDIESHDYDDLVNTINEINIMDLTPAKAIETIQQLKNLVNS